MPFIGVLAKENDYNFIKKTITKNSEEIKFDFVNINKKSIENIKNIRFETIVINENIEEFLDNSKYLENILNNAKYIVINSDIMEEKNLNLFSNVQIVTFGLNRNACITISSIENENILICVHKCFKRIDGSLIEEQEISIEMLKNNLKKICNSMAIFGVLSIYGKFLKKI